MTSTSDEPSQAMFAAALLTQFLLLAAALVVGHALTRYNVSWIGDAGVAILLGMLGGLLGKLPFLDDSYARLIEFKSGIFFYFLLPPIMFDAGYSMDVSSFLRNFISILAYALVGTTISMFCIAGNMWVAGRLGLSFRLNWLQSLLFGSIVSATDPVAVLSVFRKLHVNEDLYINVFGESALNDAVGMVLYQTVAHFLQPGIEITTWSIMQGAGMFILIFVGSMVVGLVVGACCSLLFKTQFFHEEHSTLEACIVLMFAFSSYLVATTMGLSGIISCMFCAMVMSRYTRPNLSVTARMQVSAVTEVLAASCELFVFVYMGSIAFTIPWSTQMLVFTAVSLFALAHSRAANILPLSLILNKTIRGTNPISMRQQFVMWWAGLRGGMAFALSLEASAAFGEVGTLMMSATFLQSLVTVLVNGGLVAFFIERFKLKADDIEGTHFDRLATEDETNAAALDGEYIPPSPASPSSLGALETMSPLYTIRRSRSKRYSRSSKSFHDVIMDLDKRTLSRFFIHASQQLARTNSNISEDGRGAVEPVLLHSNSA